MIFSQIETRYVVNIQPPHKANADVINLADPQPRRPAASVARQMNLTQVRREPEEEIAAKERKTVESETRVSDDVLSNLPARGIETDSDEKSGDDGDEQAKEECPRD